MVLLTWRPILEFPPLWNAKYLELSFPLILQIVWVVPSILSIDHIGQGYQVTLTIAAIFDIGKKPLLKNFGVVSKISLSWLHHQLYAVTVRGLFYWNLYHQYHMIQCRLSYTLVEICWIFPVWYIKIHISWFIVETTVVWSLTLIVSLHQNIHIVKHCQYWPTCRWKSVRPH